MHGAGNLDMQLSASIGCRMVIAVEPTARWVDLGVHGDHVPFKAGLPSSRPQLAGTECRRIFR